MTEVDESGMLRAATLHDDARGAQREAMARWAALEPALEALIATIAEVADSFFAQDRIRLRALYVDDPVVEDQIGRSWHLRTGARRAPTPRTLRRA